MRTDANPPSLSPGRAQARVAVTYRSEWDDGYGAQGWKLDAAMRDGEVIACTAYTGGKVPTSVLVHDILDHWLCGFGASGHRNEAKATTQLGLRVRTEIRSSFEAMVDDVLHDRVAGESLGSFLDDPPLHGLAPGAARSPEDLRRLERELGTDRLRSLLLTHFYEIGLRGVPEALDAWRNRGLDYARRFAIGMALQHLMVEAEQAFAGVEDVVGRGRFVIDNESCALGMTWSKDGEQESNRRTLVLRREVEC
jgi:hypothetical protein